MSDQTHALNVFLVPRAHYIIHLAGRVEALISPPPKRCATTAAASAMDFGCSLHVSPGQPATGLAAYQSTR